MPSIKNDKIRPIKPVLEDLGEVLSGPKFLWNNCIIWICAAVVAGFAIVIYSTQQLVSVPLRLERKETTWEQVISKPSSIEIYNLRKDVVMYKAEQNRLKNDLEKIKAEHSKLVGSLIDDLVKTKSAATGDGDLWSRLDEQFKQLPPSKVEKK